MFEFDWKQEKNIFKKKWFGANWWEGCQIPTHPKKIVWRKPLKKTLEKILLVNDKSLCIHMFTLATQHTWYIYIYIYSIFYKPHPISKQQANYLQSNMQWQQMTLAYCSLVTFHTIFFANYGQKHLNVDENENKILNENAQMKMDE